jgi:hypothetical protein
MIELQGKKVLFYGPAPTKDKADIDIDEFDVTIITNNMISLFFDKYKPQKTKIVLFVNKLFCKENYQEINKKSDKISEVWVKSDMRKNSSVCQPILQPNFEQILVLKARIKSIKKVPLGLSILINHLKYFELLKLYISGVTFYSGLYEKYESGYQLKSPRKGKKIKNIISSKHHLPSNIQYVKEYVKNNKNVYVCQELKKVLDQR